MDGSVLLMGATGNVGGEIVRQFPDRERLHAAVQRPTDAARLPVSDVRAVTFSFTTPETFTAFEGVERVFLMRPPALSNVPRDIQPAIDAAVRAGVKQIVFLSLQGVEKLSFVPHAKIEAAIIASGIPYTFLRCGFFMQNLSTTHQAEIRDRDEIAIPAGRSKTAFIDVRDIAAVAVRVLTEPIGANQTLTLTGSAALDYTTVAHILSATLGRTIRYTDPSILRYIFQQRAAGSPWGYALVLTMLYTITRFGNAAEVSPNVERILGRAPITFEQYACDNSAAWMKQATIS
ncbi:MAG: SDR family oxidoreductase [Chloroflexota bacterium]|nr:SDR family oxidoreductase [Chloroflexota bacterium]